MLIIIWKTEGRVPQLVGIILTLEESLIFQQIISISVGENDLCDISSCLCEINESNIRYSIGYF